MTLKAVNSIGTVERDFKIVIGDKIALTPPMGWNSWNCWGNSVSQEKVMSSAQAMLDKGLVDYGWSFINIDDGWQGLRGGKANAIQPNSKFPDMKALGDFSFQWPETRNLFRTVGGYICRALRRKC